MSVYDHWLNERILKLVNYKLYSHMIIFLESSRNFCLVILAIFELISKKFETANPLMWWEFVSAQKRHTMN